jgi:uncharacterized protein (DUF1330 family)
MRKNLVKQSALIALSFATTTCLMSCGNDKTNSNSLNTIATEIKKEVANEPAQPELTVTAPQLYKDYEANGVAADQKYKGKTIEVSGTIDNIDKDILDEIYVTLKGDEYFGSIQCYFSDEYTEQTAKLSKGQKLTVVGTCDGKLMNVLMKECSMK